MTSAGHLLRWIALGLLTVLAGCAGIEIDATGPTASTVEALRSVPLAPARVTTFRLAPGKDAAMDTALGGLRGAGLAPAKGTWSRLLQDTLVAELTAAGLYDPTADSIIDGQLTDSQVDAAISTGTARLGAQFTVTRAGRVVFDKRLVVDDSWPSSFVGAVAVPEAMNRYGALYKKLVAQLVRDPDFQQALSSRRSMP